MVGDRAQPGRLWAMIAVVAGALLTAVVVWLVPPLIYPAQAAEARAALQAGLLTATAAIVAVGGGLVALFETRRANEDTHVRELYTRAVDQLGADEEIIRLGGIYALERIATDSPGDGRTVGEVLSAFVRSRSTDPTLRMSQPTLQAADVRAAVQVLGRRPVRPDLYLRMRADLHGADLTGPASLADLDLVAANLAYVHLDGADLSRARLSNADLFRAHLNGTLLTEARLRRATLIGAYIDGANMIGALLIDANLMGATLRGSNLAGADLRGADLSGAEGLTQEQVNSAIGDRRTRLPVGLTRPLSWMSMPA
ncbi:pentapeptide repeat-containing protein [Parafrankia soli]|uniref:pentapeptide repeat-containing protein n=1 Tax=Parafrankia soli TaxID=2599596 RepID=UPI0009F57B5C|nr:pentapeptide repeat-containing protein [Parafrankia soli]